MIVSIFGANEQTITVGYDWTKHTQNLHFNGFILEVVRAFTAQLFRDFSVQIIVVLQLSAIIVRSIALFWSF